MAQRTGDSGEITEYLTSLVDVLNAISNMNWEDTNTLERNERWFEEHCKIFGLILLLVQHVLAVNNHVSFSFF